MASLTERILLKRRDWRNTLVGMLYLRLRLGVLGIAIGVLAGILGFISIEGYSLNEAFYMVVITLSTVGYTEVRPLSPDGRVFASFLIITNIGVFLYVLSAITSFFVDGEARKLMLSLRLKQRMEKLEGHVIVCGYGRNGRKVCDELLLSGNTVLVVETNPQLEPTTAYDNLIFVEGDATHEAVLERCGIQHASALISALPKDADNVFVVLSARELNPNIRIISRASQEGSISKLYRAGANHVVLPEILGGQYMAQLYHRPEVAEFLKLLSMEDHEAFLVGIVAAEDLGERHLGKSLAELDLRSRTGATIAGLIQAGQQYTINPEPTVQLAPGMKLILLGHKRQLERGIQELCGELT